MKRLDQFSQSVPVRVPVLASRVKRVSLIPQIQNNALEALKVLFTCAEPGLLSDDAFSLFPLLLVCKQLRAAWELAWRNRNCNWQSYTDVDLQQFPFKPGPWLGTVFTRPIELTNRSSLGLLCSQTCQAVAKGAIGALATLHQGSLQLIKGLSGTQKEPIKWMLIACLQHDNAPALAIVLNTILRITDNGKLPSPHCWMKSGFPFECLEFLLRQWENGVLNSENWDWNEVALYDSIDPYLWEPEQYWRQSIFLLRCRLRVPGFLSHFACSELLLNVIHSIYVMGWPVAVQFAEHPVIDDIAQRCHLDGEWKTNNRYRHYFAEKDFQRVNPGVRWFLKAMHLPYESLSGDWAAEMIATDSTLSIEEKEMHISALDMFKQIPQSPLSTIISPSTYLLANRSRYYLEFLTVAPSSPGTVILVEEQDTLYERSKTLIENGWKKEVHESLVRICDYQIASDPNAYKQAIDVYLSTSTLLSSPLNTSKARTLSISLWIISSSTTKAQQLLRLISCELSLFVNGLVSAAELDVLLQPFQ